MKKLGIKKTLCALVLAAGLALAPKPSAADIGKKLDTIVKENPSEVGKQKSEYSAGYSLRWTDRRFQGFYGEMSNQNRRIWLTLGVYVSNNYLLYEQNPISPDLTNQLLGGEIVERLNRRETYLDSTINYTFYRYTLNPTWKRPYQIEFEIRGGAGLGLNIIYDDHAYTYKALTGDEVQMTLPGLSYKAKMIFTATPIVKIGPATVRYTFEVNTDRKMGHILGVGIRF